jgi:hypothetical protein
METRPPGKAPGTKHETRDADIRSLVIFAAALAGTVLLVMLMMARVFHYFGATQSLGPPASPFAEARTLPPQPRLQVEPRVDLDHLRAHEDAMLHSYGWVDKNAGVVHIPIERAMDLVMERGLPLRKEGGGKKKP